MSLEQDFQAVLSNKNDPLHQKALDFQKYTEQLLGTPSGQEWFKTLCAFAGHPMFHVPMSDPVISAHLHGRSEVTAFLFRRGSDAAIPILPVIRNTKPTEQNGKHKQRRKTTP